MTTDCWMGDNSLSEKTEIPFDSPVIDSSVCRFSLHGTHFLKIELNLVE